MKQRNLWILALECCSYVIAVSITSSSSFTPIAISFQDLLQRDRSAAHLAANTLVTDGILQIADIPRYSESRIEALSGLGSCLQEDPTAITEMMKDQSRRLSTGAATLDGIPGSMKSKCGDRASKLRATVDGAVRLLMQGLDITSSDLRGDSSSPLFLLEPYKRFVDIIDRGSHLEHMHSYFPATDAARSNSSHVNTVDLHTDGGLFVAFTPAFYDGRTNIRDDNSGLYIKMPTGIISEVTVSENSLVLMIGAAAGSWLAPILGRPLRPVPHKVVSGLSASDGGRRNWFGKMFLPPPDALIKDKSENSALPYSEYRRREIKILAERKYNDDYFLCANLPFSPLSVANLASSSMACKTDEGYEGVMCWQICYSTELLACGQSAQCVDTGNNNEVLLCDIFTYANWKHIFF